MGKADGEGKRRGGKECDVVYKINELEYVYVKEKERVSEKRR